MHLYIVRRMNILTAAEITMTETIQVSADVDQKYKKGTNSMFSQPSVLRDELGFFTMITPIHC